MFVDDMFLANIFLADMFCGRAFVAEDRGVQRGRFYGYVNLLSSGRVLGLFSGAWGGEVAYN